MFLRITPRQIGALLIKNWMGIAIARASTPRHAENVRGRGDDHAGLLPIRKVLKSKVSPLGQMRLRASGVCDSGGRRATVAFVGEGVGTRENGTEATDFTSIARLFISNFALLL